MSAQNMTQTNGESKKIKKKTLIKIAIFIPLCVIVIVVTLVGVLTRDKDLSKSESTSDNQGTMTSTPSSELSSTPNSIVSTGPCKNGIEAYPNNLPNSNYYTRLCTTQHDLRIISGGIASDEALEQTATLINSIMDYVDPRADAFLIQWCFSSGVINSFCHLRDF